MLVHNVYSSHIVVLGSCAIARFSIDFNFLLCYVLDKLKQLHIYNE